MDAHYSRYAPELIIQHDPLSTASEAFKIVRTNIEFSSFDKKLQTIAITSTNQSEGKSNVIGNLAISFAQIGRKVLLVDADMRRPTLHRLFGLSNRRGLTNALLSLDSYQNYVQATQTENLSIITAGPVPPNPAELLLSNVMNQFLEMARTDYDLIIFDCPPVGVVTDAAILATKVDGTLYVVRSGKVDKRQLKRAAALLNQVKARVLGYIFNGIKQNTDDYYYYQNEYYSEREGGQSNSRRRSPKKARSNVRPNSSFQKQFAPDQGQPTIRASQPFTKQKDAEIRQDFCMDKAGLESEDD